MSKPINLHSGTGELESIPGYGIIRAAGLTVPADGTTGYATGCTFHHLDGGDGTAFYINEGTSTSCDFNAVNP